MSPSESGAAARRNVSALAYRRFATALAAGCYPDGSAPAPRFPMPARRAETERGAGAARERLAKPRAGTALAPCPRCASRTRRDCGFFDVFNGHGFNIQPRCTCGKTRIAAICTNGSEFLSGLCSHAHENETRAAFLSCAVDARPASVNAGRLPLRADVIGTAEETRLVAAFADLPFKEFEFHGFLGRRRGVSFGLRYDFTGDGLKVAEPMPAFLLPLRERAAAFAGLRPDSLQHALVTEYQKGVSIGWHRDRPNYDDVIGISTPLALHLPHAAKARRRLGARFAAARSPLDLSDARSRARPMGALNPGGGCASLLGHVPIAATSSFAIAGNKNLVLTLLT